VYQVRIWIAIFENRPSAGPFERLSQVRSPFMSQGLSSCPLRSSVKVDSSAEPAKHRGKFAQKVTKKYPSLRTVRALGLSRGCSRRGPFMSQVCLRVLHFKAARRLRTAASAARRTLSSVNPPICGVAMTLGWANRGDSARGGSGSKTSVA
jgi:hypothetical protein